WTKSVAIGSGQGPVYITENNDVAYEENRERLISELQEIYDPNGDKIGDSIKKGESEYTGKYADEAPDIIIEQPAGLYIDGSLGKKDIFTKPKDEGWIAENKPTGMFAASGPDISSGELSEISILDLAPTILHLQDSPIPEYMEGEVLESVFSKESPPAKREPRFENYPLYKNGTHRRRTSDELQNRLADLGYLE
ncbi:MAG: nucleotide pyrophosphatase, partial [Candidatus Paceibacteria bacterium]